MNFPANVAQLLALLFLFGSVSQEAGAFILPYATRTKDFSSWTPATQGDTNTIGMAGATVALPTSISSAETNPAGYAMMTGSVSAQINSTNFNDKRLQRSGDSVSSSQWGFGLSPADWGFSIAYYSPQTESGTYVTPNTGDTVRTEVALKELRFTLARALLENRLSIGAALELAKAVRELDDASISTFGPSFQLGALYRIPNHVLLGLSFSPQLTVGPSGHPDPDTALPGFNRAVVRPMLISLGTGWMPNRFFKVGISLTFVGSTENTALLYDETIETGKSASWVPRLGVSYVIAEYGGLKVEAAAGTYYESSRLSNMPDRLHATAGIEVNPSFINLGAGFDIASGYRNYIVSAGIDIVRTARTFNIIPKETIPPYSGFFPNISKLSPDGLPSGLTADEHKKFEEQSVQEVGKIISDVPGNIAKKAAGEKTTVELKEAKDIKSGKIKVAPRSKFVTKIIEATSTKEAKAAAAEAAAGASRSRRPVASPTPSPSLSPEVPSNAAFPQVQ